jgi:uncharacterized phage protein (TIGR02218 family)
VKTIPAGLQAHYETGTTTLATLWKVTRKDTTVYGFTDHDQALTLSGTTYYPTSSFDASAIETKSELNVDDLEVIGVLSTSGVTAEDIEAGMWDGAAVEIRRVNWADLTMGAEILRVGELGNVQRRDGQYVAEMRGLMAALQNNILRIITPSCNATFGDARCGINLASHTSSGTVSSFTSRRVFVVSGFTLAVAHIGGLLTWTSGLNDGLQMEVKTVNAGTSTVTLHLPMPFDVAASDAFTISKGCDKTKATCIATFSNVVNFRGFSFVPGQDKVLLVGGQ